MVLAVALFNAPAEARSFLHTCEALFFAPSLEDSVHRSGLTESQSQLIQQHSAGLMNFKDFLPFWTTAQGYLLGLSHIMYNAVASPRGLLHWADGYPKHRIYPKAIDRTEKYMNAITSTNEVIVFLVPTALMTRESITQEEMNWLLVQPQERMRNVIFVFGAYDFFSETEMQEILSRGFRNENEIRIHLRELAGQS